MKRFLQNAGFTSRETAIIASLSLILILGIIIKYSSCSSIRKFDYTAVDENFTQKTKQDFDILKSRGLNDLQMQRSEDIKKLADSLYSMKDSSSNSKSPKPGTVININTAYLADLMTLPGIGEIMAGRIIEYREKTGGFRKTEELLYIKGIGEKKYEKIKPFVSVE